MGTTRKCGTNGEKSNKIQFHRTETDGDVSFTDDTIVTILVRGVEQEASVVSESEV